MLISDCLGVNNHGHLTIGGKDTLELAKEYGTPLYVMDEGMIRANCRRYVSAIKTHYGGKGTAAYASKAFCCKAICAVTADEGMALDIVSCGELYTALKAGFPPERILFHGNNKTDEDIAYAVSSKVGRIVVDNSNELRRVNEAAALQGGKQPVQLRITPGVDPQTHDFIRTGQVDSKFGFTLQTGEAMKAARLAAELKNISLMGAHCHIGSQILDVPTYVLTAEVMMGFIADVRDELGVTLGELNLGGGFGIRYTAAQDAPPEYERYIEGISGAIGKVCSKRGIDKPFLYIEPGRSIVGPAGITLYTVGVLKEIPEIRTYLSVDGGITDNPRFALYGSRYEMLIADRADQPKTKEYTVAGRCCESGDILGKDVPIQEAKAGDTLAVLATGAYNYSMASNYNRLPKPPVVFVKDGAAQVVVKRQTFDDILQDDV